MEVCSMCNRSYQTRSRLRQHLKEQHLFNAETVNILVPRQKKDDSFFKYPCTKCSARYNVLRSYRSHIKRVHPEIYQGTKNPVKCPLCRNEAYNMAQHLKVEHDITLEINNNLEFDNYNTFLRWKKNIERSTISKFIMRRTNTKYRNGKNLKECNYICHRSGNFKSQGKGLRPLKIQGSKKIDAYCPAAIRLQIFSDKCTAQFTETHIGHGNEPFDQSIVKHKSALARKIAIIRKRHKTAINETNFITYDDSTCKWMVFSKELYYIEINQLDCDCHLICTFCKSCIHNYTCTCIDYLIKDNMCKHIHQVCMMRVKQTDEDSKHPSECTNLISLEVKETLSNSQHERKLESDEDIPIETIRKDCYDLLKSAVTPLARRILMFYIQKAKFDIENDVK